MILKFEDIPFDTKKRINYVTQAILRDLGAPLHPSGYQYTIAAVLFMVVNPNVRLSMTTALGVYPTVAEAFDCTSYSVERSIRYLKECILLRGSLKAVNSIFGNLANPNTGLITNHSFLIALKLEVIDRLEKSV